MARFDLSGKVAKATLGDAQLQRHARTQGLMRQLDSRAGEDQPTTA